MAPYAPPFRGTQTEIRSLTLVALASVLVSACGASAAIPDKADIQELVNSTSSEIVVAASSEALVDGAAEELWKAAEDGSGGVWCSGAAQMLADRATERGWPSAVLSFGDPGTAATHAVTLIEAGEDWWIADAYLGGVWSVPYRTAIQALQDGEAIDFEGPGVTREVIFAERPTDESPSWLVGDAGLDPQECDSVPAGWKCRLDHGIDDFLGAFNPEDFGPSSNFSGGPVKKFGFGLLEPYGLSVDGTYFPVETPADVLERLGTVPE